MIHAAAPGNKANQKFKWCNLTPSMNRIGKLAAVLKIRPSDVGMDIYNESNG